MRSTKITTKTFETFINFFFETKKHETNKSEYKFQLSEVKAFSNCNFFPYKNAHCPKRKNRNKTKKEFGYEKEKKRHTLSINKLNFAIN